MERLIGYHKLAALLPILMTVAILAVAQTHPMLVSEAVARRLVKFKLEPEYPATARQFKIAGDVVAQITIGADGKVESVDDVKGNLLLQASVKMAVRKWIFAPFLDEGKPARIRTTLSFNFHFKD